MPLMRKLGGDIGNFLAKVIDTATDPVGATLIGAGVAAGIYTYFKKKGGNIQIFSKNAIAHLGKISQPSLWRKISNALTIKAPNIKLPTLTLKIPKALQPLIDAISKAAKTTTNVTPPPPSAASKVGGAVDDIVKHGSKIKSSLGMVGALFEPVRVGVSAIMDTWKSADPEGWMAFQMATGGLDPNSPAGIMKQVTGLGGFAYGRTMEESARTQGGHNINGQDIRFGKGGDTPSSSITGDWGMGGVPSPTVIIQADTITMEAIDNVTDKMVNGKRTFSSLG